MSSNAPDQTELTVDARSDTRSDTRSIDPAVRPRDELTELAVVDPAHYAIDHEIARGGMGRILAATDLRHGRPVALKVLLAEDAISRRRFVREALISARLQHPNILPVYETGRWPTGEPFLAMKRIGGESLADLLDRSPELADRLRLLPHVLAAADAIAYAHSKGVLHRDLKPANIMLSEYGETLVIDWGVARLADDESDDDTDQQTNVDVGGELTVAGAVLGTPRYMSPEQARGERPGRTSDVYSLGAVLYHVLAGKAPLHGVATDVIRMLVTEGAVPRLAELAKDVPHELVTIVDKAMAHSPADRYPSAEELAAELRRFTTGELVRAHSYTLRALLKRWARRNRTVLAAAAVLVAVLATTATIAAIRVLDERDRAEAATVVAEQAQATAEAERGRAETARDELLLSGSRTLLDSDPTRALELVARYARTSRTPDWRTIESIAVDARSRGIARYRLADVHTSIAFGGARLAFVRDRRAHVLELETGAVRALDLANRIGVVLSPDGTRVAAVGKAPGVVVTELATGARREAFPEANDVAFSPDGSELAVVSQHTVHLLHAGDLAPIRTYAIAKAWRVGFVPGGTWLYVSDGEGGHSLVDRQTGAVRALPPRITNVRDAAIAASGALLAWGADGAAIVHDIARGTQRSLPLPKSGTALHCAFAPGGTELACTGTDRAVTRWELASGRALPTLVLDDWGVRVAFTPDDSRMIASSETGAVVVWDRRTGDALPLRGHEDKALLHVSRDGRWLASVSFSGHLRVWPLGRDHRARTLGDRLLEQYPPFAMRPASRVVTVLNNQLVHWDLERDHIAAAPGTFSFGLALSRDGDRMLAGCETTEPTLWDLVAHSSQRLGTTAAPIACSALALASDATLAATGTQTGDVDVWDRGVHRKLGTINESPAILRIAPDRRHVLAAISAIHVWPVAGGSGRVLAGHTITYDAKWSPDGRTIASCGSDKLVKLWDVATGTARTLAGHTATVYQLAFSPDGTRVASSSDDRTARVWNVATGAVEHVLEHGEKVQGIAFSPDGRTLAVAGKASMVSLWDPRTGRRFEVLRGSTADNEFVELDDRWVVARNSALLHAWRYDRDAAERPRDAAWLDALVVRDR